MITRSDIENEFTSRAYIANNSTEFPSARVTQLVQDSYLWAGSLYMWPSLNRSRIFSTKPNTQSFNYDYYDYPVDFLDNSISRLYIAGKKYDKKAFQDFVDYTDQSNSGSLPPDTSKRYFAEFGRQFFVFPKVSVAGSSDGIVWGNIQPLQLGSANDKTIFSLWDDSGNEAILRKALAAAFERIDTGFANENEQKAVELLKVIWKKVTDQLQRAQRLDHPYFQVFDMFGRNASQSTIGNFNNVDVVS